MIRTPCRRCWMSNGTANRRLARNAFPRDVALAQMKIMLAAMERAYGKKPVIYTSIDFHRDVMQGEFTDYPVWVRSVKCHPPSNMPIAAGISGSIRLRAMWPAFAAMSIAMRSMVRPRIGKPGSPTTNRSQTTNRLARAALDTLRELTRHHQMPGLNTGLNWDWRLPAANFAHRASCSRTRPNEASPRAHCAGEKSGQSY